MLRDFLTIYLTYRIIHWCIQLHVFSLGFEAQEMICLKTQSDFLRPCSSITVDGCSTRSYQQAAPCAAVCIPPTVKLTTVLWGFSGLLWYRHLHSFSGPLLSLSPALSPYLRWHGAKNICGIPRLAPHGRQTLVAIKFHSCTPISHPLGCTVLCSLAVVVFLKRQQHHAYNPHCL